MAVKYHVKPQTIRAVKDSLTPRAKKLWKKIENEGSDSLNTFTLTTYSCSYMFSLVKLQFLRTYYVVRKPKGLFAALAHFVGVVSQFLDE